MADATTTGSAVIGGLVGGMQKGLLGATSVGSEALHVTDKILFVYGNPDEVITSSIGSQIAFNLEENDIYMTDLGGGSEWSRLGVV